MKDINIAESRNFLLKESIELDEMAKIQGDLKDAIEAVIAANPELDGLPLKKAIKADQKVVDALAGEDLYDNQLNKFIASAKGERTVGTRGRQATPASAKSDIAADLGSSSKKALSEPGFEDDDVEITDTWNAQDEDDIDDEKGPTSKDIDNTITADVPADSDEVRQANFYKNVIVKKVNKIEKLKPQDRAASTDMTALKQFIKNPDVQKSLTPATIKSLVSSIIG